MTPILARFFENIFKSYPVTIPDAIMFFVGYLIGMILGAMWLHHLFEANGILP
jgi:hypothetical protein